MRLLWLSMVIIHIAPVVRLSTMAISGELAGVKWISLVAILLSLGFFGLKTLGAPFLRMRCGWGGAVLFLVACGLLHGNATPHHWLEKTGYTVLVVGTAAGASDQLIRCVRRRLSELGKRLRPRLQSGVDVLQRSLERADMNIIACWMRLIMVCHGPPRAPPARAALSAS